MTKASSCCIVEVRELPFARLPRLLQMESYLDSVDVDLFPRPGTLLLETSDVTPLMTSERNSSTVCSIRGDAAARVLRLRVANHRYNGILSENLEDYKDSRDARFVIICEFLGQHIRAHLQSVFLQTIN